MSGVRTELGGTAAHSARVGRGCGDWGGEASVLEASSLGAALPPGTLPTSFCSHGLSSGDLLSAGMLLSAVPPDFRVALCPVASVLEWVQETLLSFPCSEDRAGASELFPCQS